MATIDFVDYKDENYEITYPEELLKKPKSNKELLNDWYQRNIDSLEQKLKLEDNEMKRHVLIFHIASWSALKDGVMTDES